MFKNWFKKEKEGQTAEIYAPITGEIIPLEEVPDPVFSQKMMGDGIAIKPSEGNIYSPVNGKIAQIPETKHAIGLRTEDGIEILIHIGLETVTLNGKSFNVHVNTGDEVSVGQPLMDFDLEYIQNNAESDITPIVITNEKEIDKAFKMTDEKEGKLGETIIITVSKR
ncbi:PTS glucose transporter subunit IIA [Virgibacillus sp. NKC19-3]|uniref:PTS sugar transporter subunit IIA n=1 Tax=Virgibacillus saliphilus TaxID=2831674 RepID=UPI001C9B1FB1|nr:PTS glucose transporter subunit IIA [Virgibacillus sp. NKC19-3]MBY7143888.1 PTS glucose transporter subunit IIA [Virgibacillus sp. NKC19-3]